MCYQQVEFSPLSPDAGCVVNSSRSCAADDEWWGDGERCHPGGDQGNQGESPGKSRLQGSVGEQEKR